LPRCTRLPAASPVVRRRAPIVGRRQPAWFLEAAKQRKAGRARSFHSARKASSTASAAPIAEQNTQGSSNSKSESILTAPWRAWHSYWSLGRPQKQEQDKQPRKLRNIVSKLWNIMDVNGHLLTAALFCMVTAFSTTVHGMIFTSILHASRFTPSLRPMQAVAAITELAIPHFTTRTIFSVANLGSEATFYSNVKILAVRDCPAAM
jgi:hypothetical protein